VETVPAPAPAVVGAQNAVAIAVTDAQTAARDAKQSASSIPQVEADVKVLKAKAAADANAAAATAAAEAKIARFDPSTGRNQYFLSDGNKTVRFISGVSGVILRELRARSGPIETVRLLCRSVGGMSQTQLGFISDAFDITGADHFTRAGGAGVLPVGAADGAYVVEGKRQDHAFTCKAGTVLTFIVNIPGNTFAVQCDANPHVVVAWPNCPARVYFAVTFDQGWSFTLL
jgi:hypothetical protein